MNWAVTLKLFFLILLRGTEELSFYSFRKSLIKESAFAPVFYLVSNMFLWIILWKLSLLNLFHLLYICLLSVVNFYLKCYTGKVISSAKSLLISLSLTFFLALTPALPLALLTLFLQESLLISPETHLIFLTEGEQKRRDTLYSQECRLNLATPRLTHTHAHTQQVITFLSYAHMHLWGHSTDLLSYFKS